MHLKIRDHWQTGLKIILGLSLLLIAIRAGFQPTTLLATLQTLNSFWLIVTLALVLTGALLKSIRWSLLLSTVSSAATPTQVIGPLLTGQAFNMFTIARLGDAVRVWLLASQLRVPLSGIAATLIVENIFELCAYASLALILSSTFTALFNTANQLWGVLAVAPIGLLSLLFIVLYGDKLLPLLDTWLNRWRLNRVQAWLTSAFTALQPLKNQRRLWPIVTLTILIWVVAWLTNLALFNAFALNLPATAGLLILVLIILGVAPGLMPTNIGPFYFLTIFALQQYKVDSTIALAYAVVLHSMVTGVPLMGAILYLADQWRRTGLWPRLNPPPTWPRP